MMKKILSAVLTCMVCALSVAATAAMVLWGVAHVGLPGKSAGGTFFQADMMADYDRHMTNQLSSALEGVLDIEKVY